MKSLRQNKNGRTTIAELRKTSVKIQRPQVVVIFFHKAVVPSGKIHCGCLMHWPSNHYGGIIRMGNL